MASYKVWRFARNSLSKHLWPLLTIGAVVVVAVGGNWSYASDASDYESADTQVASDSQMSTEDTNITVYQSATCGCCHQWVAHLREQGFKVTIRSDAEAQAIRSGLGIPPALGSCHTAVADGYWIEGHVPADLVQQLLDEQPEDIRGIAVPGAQIGAPGMEGPNPVATYDVVAYDQDGKVSVYANREGKTDSP